MTKIIKWLNEHGIEYTFDGKKIIIMLEKDCIWINGFGQEMKYDKVLCVGGKYYLVEVTGYNMSKTLCSTTKQTTIISALERWYKRENKN